MTDNNETNTGHANSGCYNTGHLNSGCFNSGDYNSGHLNSGDFNSGDYNSGFFNTREPNVRLFNKETNMTHKEFRKKYDISIKNFPLNTFIPEKEMSKKEKKDNPSYKTTNGYLKTLTFKEACKQWWDEHPEEHNRFLNLPNFDANIFEEITGIKTTQTQTPKTITIDGEIYIKES